MKTMSSQALSGERKAYLIALRLIEMNLILTLAFSLILLSTPASAATSTAGAFVAPFRGGQNNNIKNIYSRNNDFTAMILYDRKVTRVGKITWQGNYGLTKWLWSISEAPKDAFISDDGEHLIFANYGTTHFPNELKKDDAIFSFYKGNALVRQVRASELVDDVKTLVPETFGLKWARYVLLSPCGYLTIKTVQDRDILLDPLTGKTAEVYKENPPLEGAEPPQGVQPSIGNTYRDITRCYEFEYPKAYAIKETSTIKELRPIGHYVLTRDGSMIEGDIVDLMEYRNIGAEKPFEEFVKDRVMAMQSADGDDGSRYATGLTDKKTYNNKNGLLVMEMHIKVVNERFNEGEGKSTVEETVAGPVFAVRLTPKEPSLVLFLSQYPKEGVEPPQGVSASADDIRKIVDSVRPLTWR